jgi:ABC-type branched-subunit amino acid transport system substrate-binding protein
MVNHLLAEGIKPEEIAFFTQRDSYGDAGYQGAVEQLHKRGYSKTEQLVHGRYQRNTLNVEQAVADLLMAEIEPKAVIMVGSYAAAAKFIKLSREDIPKLLFLNISFTGSDSLLSALGNNAEGVIVTQVVPNIDSGLPVVREYLKQIALSPLLGKANFISLEGYIVAWIFIEAVRKIEGNINQASLLQVMEGLGTFDIGLGYSLTLNKQERQASHKVWMTQVKGGQFSQIISRASN